MNSEEYLGKIIKEFDKWWNEHNLNTNKYTSYITYQHLVSLSKKKFIKLFYQFVSDGGLVQSGGDRAKNKFRKTITKDFDNFKKFILKPFEDTFSLKEWFSEVNNYPHFGIGIATIFLNRVDHNKYPIMNGKTLNGLNKLGYKISSTKNWTNYQLVKQYQDHLISNHPILKNYHKADALNHFIVAVYQGKKLISNYFQIEAFKNELEQQEIEHLIKSEIENLSKNDLLDKITSLENNKSEKVQIKGSTYKRHNRLMVYIKKLYKYKCQFCSTKIPKSNGGYYIEACHIKPKVEKGEDTLNNILILCPNCHKLFDHNERENEEHTEIKYAVTLNGKRYKVKFKIKKRSEDRLNYNSI